MRRRESSEEICRQRAACDNSSKPYRFHPTGTNIPFADGAVQFISESIDADTFVSLFTLRAGDSAGAY